MRLTANPLTPSLPHCIYATDSSFTHSVPRKRVSLYDVRIPEL
jgi:hypothetical protein